MSCLFQKHYKQNVITISSNLPQILSLIAIALIVSQPRKIFTRPKLPYIRNRGGRNFLHFAEISSYLTTVMRWNKILTFLIDSEFFINPDKIKDTKHFLTIPIIQKFTRLELRLNWHLKFPAKWKKHKFTHWFRRMEWIWNLRCQPQ